MIPVVKLINRRNEEQLWEVLRQGKPHFDPRPDWLLLGQPIGGKHKEIQWVHPSEITIVWLRWFAR